jgi:hypothetical protein
MKKFILFLTVICFLQTNSFSQEAKDEAGQSWKKLTFMWKAVSFFLTVQ